MTCIVGYIDPAGGVWLGADRRMCSSSGYRAYSGPKMEEYEHVCVGFTGDNMVSVDVLAGGKTWADIEARTPVIGWGVGRPALIARFGENGVKPDDDGIWPVSAIVASGAGLWIVGADLSMLRVADGMMAMGSGGQYAAGALCALRRHWQQLNFGGDEIVLEALRAAGARDENCGPPYDVWEVGAQVRRTTAAD